MISNKKKDPPIIIVYFDKEKKQSQVIKPTDEFNGDCAGLVRDMFNSVIRREDGSITYYRHYDSYEIVLPVKDTAS